MSRFSLSPHARNSAWVPVSHLAYTLGVDISSRAMGNGQSLIICLRGSVQLRTADGEWTLPAGNMQIVEGAVAVQSPGDVSNCTWAMLSGPDTAWAMSLGVHAVYTQRHLLPGRHTLAADERRQWLMLCAGGNEPAERNTALIALLAPLQRELHAQVERCPGRSLVRRRHVYSRLQRARNFLIARSANSVGLDAAAHHIGYSPCHFLRVFHRVFEETPQNFIIEQRLELARNLLRSSSLGVIEVGFASGFESRWSFARQFRRRFGVTASHFRRLQSETRSAAALIHSTNVIGGGEANHVSTMSSGATT
jgi:AraC family transcriptional regulator